MNRHPLPLADVLGYEASDKRIDILRRIGQAGSISEAARGAGVSYKAAWQAVATLTNLAGVPLVDKAVGGAGGGGAGAGRGAGGGAAGAAAPHGGGRPRRRGGGGAASGRCAGAAARV